MSEETIKRVASLTLSLEAIRALLDWNVQCNQGCCADDPDWRGVDSARELADAVLTRRSPSDSAEKELAQARADMTGGDQ